VVFAIDLPMDMLYRNLEKQSFGVAADVILALSEFINCENAEL
jgi:hypothetical protein